MLEQRSLNSVGALQETPVPLNDGLQHEGMLSIRVMICETSNDQLHLVSSHLTRPAGESVRSMLLAGRR
jgi:hypothetical protein